MEEEEEMSEEDKWKLAYELLRQHIQESAKSLQESAAGLLEALERTKKPKPDGDKEN